MRGDAASLPGYEPLTSSCQVGAKTFSGERPITGQSLNQAPRSLSIGDVPCRVYPLTRLYPRCNLLRDGGIWVQVQGRCTTLRMPLIRRSNELLA